jgi:hypothetical protein
MTTERDEHGRGPGVVAPTTRVNIALPFSHFRVQEPSRDLVELAGIVGALVDVVAASQPTAELRPLREQLDALVVRLR